MITNTEDPSELIFIQYRLSKIPHIISPLNKFAPSKNYLVSVPDQVIKMIYGFGGISCHTIHLSEEDLAAEGVHVDSPLFAKSCKLYFLKKIKLIKKPIIVFTCSGFGQDIKLTLEEDLPRKISCKSYPVEDFKHLKYYTSFEELNNETNELIGLSFERASALSTTALTYS